MSTTTIKQLRQIFVESDMTSPELLQTATGAVTVLCRRCPEKVEPNDDSAAVVQTDWGATVLAVADGVGGCAHGYKASAIAVKSVVECVEAAEPMSDLRPAILDAIESANREIMDLGIGAATTLAVVELRERTARCYQVGDCMTLIVGQRGALKWKSTSHSPVGYAVESGLLDEVAAMTHDERHIVSNVIGTQSMHIEVGPAKQLAVRDTVLIASDGLFDNLHLSEVIERSRRGKPLDRVAALAELASTRMTGQDAELAGKPDDLTILLYA